MPLDLLPSWQCSRWMSTSCRTQMIRLHPELYYPLYLLRLEQKHLSCDHFSLSYRQKSVNLYCSTRANMMSVLQNGQCQNDARDTITLNSRHKPNHSPPRHRHRWRCLLEGRSGGHRFLLLRILMLSVLRKCWSEIRFFRGADVCRTII